VDRAAFELAIGLGGLLHGHGRVRAQAELAVGQQRDRVVDGAGGAVGAGLGERDAVIGGWSDKVMTRPGPSARSIASARTPVPAASNTMTRPGPPARSIASARTPVPAASNTASTGPSARTRLARPGP
jgi:hypothetical protein